METLTTRPLGELRVYLTQADKHARPGLGGRLFPAPLAHALVDAAHAFGLLQATTLHSHYGYVRGGAVAARHFEVETGRLAQCVVLLDEPARLRAFCQQHATLLRGRLLVFSAAEEWAV